MLTVTVVIELKMLCDGDDGVSWRQLMTIMRMVMNW